MKHAGHDEPITSLFMGKGDGLAAGCHGDKNPCIFDAPAAVVGISTTMAAEVLYLSIIVSYYRCKPLLINVPG